MGEGIMKPTHVESRDIHNSCKDVLLSDKLTMQASIIMTMTINCEIAEMSQDTPFGRLICSVVNSK